MKTVWKFAKKKKKKTIICISIRQSWEKKSVENLGGKAKPKENKSNYEEQECYEVGAF